MNEETNITKEHQPDEMEERKAIIGLVDLIKSSEKVRAAVLDEMRDKKSQKLLNASKGTYYKEVYARQIQPYVDQMIQDGKDRSFPYEAFSSDVSHGTVYARLEQSLRYLVKEMDTTAGIYLKFRKDVEICKEKSGVAFRFTSNLIQSVPPLPSPHIAQKPDECMRWKHLVEEFLETEWTPETKKEDLMLHLKGLNLSSDEVEMVEMLKSNSITVIGKVNQSEIKLLKVSPETKEKL